MNTMHWKSRKQRIAVQRFCILAAGLLLHSGAFRQRDVAGSKRVAHLQRRGHFPRDEAIRRSRHAPVEFRKHQNIGIVQFLAFTKALNDWIQLHSALNVPGNDAHRLTGARTGWNSWSKFLVPYIGQDAFDLRLQLAIQPGLFEILGTLELSKIAEERPE